MTTYLLDTNVCIAIINGDAMVRSKYAKASDEAHGVLTSSVVTFELWYGAAKSNRPEANRERVEVFLSAVAVLGFDDDDARAAGRIRAELQAAGQGIGAYDTLIAGQALRRGMLLVTANSREFSRVGGLRWEDWSQS